MATTTHLHNKPICKICKSVLDGASHPDGGRGPEPGDFNICMYCGTLGVYDQDMNVVAATEEQIAEAIKGDPTFEEGVRKAKKLAAACREFKQREQN